MWIYWAILVLAVLFLTPKPKLQNERAAGLAEINVNTTSAARPIPYIAGKELYTGSNIFWYGDLQTVAITEKVDTGLFSSEKVTTGHKYHLGLGLGICWGDDVTIHEIRFGDKVGWTGSVTGNGTAIAIDEPSLFGKQDEEGGVKGTATFYKGSSGQSPDTYLNGQISGGVPAYPFLSYLSFNQFYWGNSPSLPMVNVVVSRYPDPLGQGISKAKIGDDANPAYIMFELITSRLFGMGIGQPLLHNSSFISVGDDLVTEGLGLTFTFDSTLTGEDAVQQILKHINGTIYTDLTDGLIHIDLSRDDYTIGTLTVIDDSVIQSVQSFGRGSLDSLATELKIKYKDRSENYTDAIEPAVNTAMRFQLDRATPMEIPYYGIRTAEIANRVAWRDLKAATIPLAQLKLLLNRSAYGLRRGQVINLQSTRYNIGQLICRVQSVDYGELADNAIVATVIEDVFSYGTAVFGDNPSSGTTPLSGPPTNVVDIYMQDLPYYYLDNLGLTEARLMISAAAPGGDHLDYDLLSRVSGSGSYLADERARPFSGLSTLTSAINETTGTVTLDDINLGLVDHINADIKAQGVNLILLEDGTDIEIISFTTVTEGATTVLTGVERGLLDTLPRSWSLGDNAWVLENYVVSAYQYGTTNTVQAKLLTRSLQGVLTEAAATQFSEVLTDRADRPYNVRQFLVNAVQYPTSVNGGLTFTWKENDRVASPFLFESDATVTVEAGVTYDITLRDSTDTSIVKQWLAYSGTSVAYTEAQEIIDNGALTNTLRIEVVANRGGKASMVTLSHDFTRIPT